MKRIITLFFAVITTISVSSQTYFQDGDRCFNGGDYACAVTNYYNAFKNATGRDKQIAEIKLTRAKWCTEHIKTANQAFAAKNYSIAKNEYQKVLDTNPKDRYAQSQMVKCDNALNQQEIDKKATYLRLSKSTLYFTSYGKTNEQIKVYSDASTFSVPPYYIPSWCTVKTHEGYFTVKTSANPSYTKRKGWFKVKAGGKEVRINIEQLGKTSPNPQHSSSPKEQPAIKCFNCPKTHDTWGLTFGYTQQTIYYSMDVIQFGLKVEPLFRYGFGLNTGINLLGYWDSVLFESGFDFYAVNIPLHLEYRLNFSKWFNMFAYGGVGFNAMTNSDFDNYTLPITFEYGGGFRISHVQFNLGSSIYLGDLRNTQNFGKNTETYQKLIFSISYMF